MTPRANGRRSPSATPVVANVAFHDSVTACHVIKTLELSLTVLADGGTYFKAEQNWPGQAFTLTRQTGKLSWNYCG
jgi:hypothetical protein